MSDTRDQVRAAIYHGQSLIPGRSRRVLLPSMIPCSQAHANADHTATGILATAWSCRVLDTLGSGDLGRQHIACCRALIRRYQYTSSSCCGRKHSNDDAYASNRDEVYRGLDGVQGPVKSEASQYIRSRCNPELPASQSLLAV